MHHNLQLYNTLNSLAVYLPKAKLKENKYITKSATQIKKHITPVLLVLHTTVNSLLPGLDIFDCGVKNSMTGVIMPFDLSAYLVIIGFL